MSSVETEADEETGAEAYTTVTENHFGTTYTSVTREKSVSYTAGTNTAEYSYQTTGTDEDEKLSADTVKYNDSIILSSAYTYDDNGNVLSKSYGESNVFTNTYDDKDRIISTSYAGKTYNYTYDTDSQLTGVTGNNYSASYGYDSRGNITSKTVNDETTTFTYANSGWKDLLVSVNGTELTYDANGNVLTYGDKEYTWNTGRNLESITDGDNTYSYTYDESGIRTSKTVNGVTTYFNTKDGVILSQTDGTNTWYFQYDTNGTPLGFVLNGVQYFYITNQMNDVLAITDTSGTIVGNYEYDAWGKVLTADTSIAQQNPLRYRGYYLDSETEYYYLQSRYYDPSICRFINSDIAEISQMSKGLANGVNIFAYCNNDPTNSSDPNGFAAKKYTVSQAKSRIINVFNKYLKFIKKYILSSYIDFQIAGHKISTVCNNLNTLSSILTMVAGVGASIAAVAAICTFLSAGTTSAIAVAAGTLAGAAGIAAGYVSLVSTRLNAHNKGCNLTLRLYTKGAIGTFKVYERWLHA